MYFASIWFYLSLFVLVDKVIELSLVKEGLKSISQFSFSKQGIPGLNVVQSVDFS